MTTILLQDKNYTKKLKTVHKKERKIECCDICVDIREQKGNKKQKNKLYIPLIIVFFIAAVLLL